MDTTYMKQLKHLFLILIISSLRINSHIDSYIINRYTTEYKHKNRVVDRSVTNLLASEDVNLSRDQSLSPTSVQTFDGRKERSGCT